MKLNVRIALMNVLNAFRQIIALNVLKNIIFKIFIVLNVLLIAHNVKVDKIAKNVMITIHGSKKK